MTTPMPNSIQERTGQYLAAIERRNPDLHAFITVAGDSARQRAAELDAGEGNGSSRGPLHGRVVAVKDNIDTAGMRTTLGSKYHAERIPNDDAEVVRRLRRAGAVVIGKCNLNELAFGATGQNPHYGGCRNPWNLDRVPGGSSGGSGAAVAAGMCDAALGTDTGGSVRIPASLNGIAGLRPTVGRISNRGIEPVAPQLDTVGPMARTVAEIATVYEAIAGFDPQDDFSVNRPVESWQSALPNGPGGLRVGLPNESFFDGVDEGVGAVVRTAAKALSDLGAEMRLVDLREADDLHTRLKALVPTNIAARNYQRLIAHPDTFGDDVRERMSLGLKTTGIDYADWLRLSERWRMRVRKLFETVDVILTPTVSIEAPKITAADDMIVTTGELTRLTFVWAYAGLPALSVPCGFTRKELPVGMQLIGPQWSEALLLALGAAYQGATSFHHRWPSVTD